MNTSSNTPTGFTHYCLLRLLNKPGKQYLLYWLLLSLLEGALPAWAQQPPASTDYYPVLKNKDLSRLWLPLRRSHPDPQMRTNVAFPDPIGFIGPTYQRFYVHYTSIQKDPANPHVYRVKGKTRVKNNVCSFDGTITLLKARLYKEPNSSYPQFREGELSCRLIFSEDRRQAGSGTITSTLTSFFYLDQRGEPQYNLLELYADNFGNNECVGSWQSYTSGQRKVCNWGDFFIPQAGPLRYSDTEFDIAPAYRANGWQTYHQLITGGSGEPATRRARAEEDWPWWK